MGGSDSIDLAFHYAEIKSLAIAFVTLVTSVFTVSVAFAEKFIATDSPSKERRSLLWAWTLFLFALAAAGVGLALAFGAAAEAHGGTLMGSSELKLPAALFLMGLAGFAFLIGLVLLARCALSRLGPSPSTKDAA